MSWPFNGALAGLAISLLNSMSSLFVHVQTNVEYGQESTQRADIYRPRDDNKHPVVVFLYGGGWRVGSKEGVAYVGAALARRGIVAVIPEYRHFPAATLPDILTDNSAAVAWAVAHAPEFGGDRQRVFLAGHSSGAWAATMLALDPKWLEQTGLEPNALAGIIGISGPYSTSSLVEQEDKDIFAELGPEMMPINHCSDRAAPMLLLTGSADVEVLPSSTLSFADRLRNLGDNAETHIYPGLNHQYILYATSLPFSLTSSVSSDIKEFISHTIKNPSSH